MTENAPVCSVGDIPGWFNPADQLLFEFFLDVARGAEEGDLVELGAYLGKSTAHMGAFLHPGETFTVCDLFGSSAGDDENAAENAKSYASLERGAFERNYRAVRGDLPSIVQGPSSVITEHVAAGSARFVHVDASHLYEHVALDVDSAEKLLKPGGIAVFDDYRSPHTPGVAAAVWTAVAQGRMTPICLSRSKLYATYGDGAPYRKQLEDWLPAQPSLNWERQRIGETDVVRVWMPTRKRDEPKSPAPVELTGQLDRINRRLKRIEKTLAASERQTLIERAARRLRSGR